MGRACPLRWNVWFRRPIYSLCFWQFLIGLVNSNLWARAVLACKDFHAKAASTFFTKLHFLKITRLLSRSGEIPYLELIWTNWLNHFNRLGFRPIAAAERSFRTQTAWAAIFKRSLSVHRLALCHVPSRVITYSEKPYEHNREKQLLPGE